jgi:hypothetical protein
LFEGSSALRFPPYRFVAGSIFRVQNVNGQRQDGLIPKIPKFATGVPEGQAPKSGAAYNDWTESKFSFDRFGFHRCNRKEQIRRQMSEHFLAFF